MTEDHSLKPLTDGVGETALLTITLLIVFADTPADVEESVKINNIVNKLNRQQQPTSSDSTICGFKAAHVH